MSADKLAGVHPNLVAKLTRILAAMTAFGHPMRVTDGVRTVAEQRRLFAQGRTPGVPGGIVTNCDGIVKKSNHQPHDDGYGHAVDCAFIAPTLAEMYAPSQPWSVFGALAEYEGLHWGGRWASKLVDRPHLELP